MRSPRLVALAQAIFYLVTGVWPLVHMRSFMAVTGPKTDGWLVQTAGVLITAIGAAIGLAAARDRVTPEVRLLAAGSAAGLAAIDVIHTARRRISPIYLLDALAELALLAWWAAARTAEARNVLHESVSPHELPYTRKMSE